MNNRRDIDNIYRERFTNARLSPPEDAWDNIVSRLPQKSRKNVILPFWYLLAGTAAAVALFFMIYSGNEQDIATNPSFTVGEHPSKSIHDKIDAALQPFELQISATGNFLKELQKIQFKTAPKPELQLAEVSKKAFKRPFVFSEDSQFKKELRSSTSLPPVAVAVIEDYSDKEQTAPSLPLNEDKVKEIESLNSEKRFSVTTRVAPVFFDHMGKGNLLDSRFSQNKSGGEVSMSYGVNVSYKLSEKVKLRSGISKVELAYNTTQISFNDYAGTTSKKRQEEFGITLASPVKGELHQSMGFIEVPFEVEYALLDKQIGINLIGGASALFLEDNEVLLSSPSFSNHFGAAENLNSFSLSANIGLGFDYDFAKNLGLSIEPLFKLQVNTFKDAQDFNPYYFGIYSGLSYSF